MSILKEKKDNTSNGDSPGSGKELVGYERPLFEESLPKWSDDQMMGGGGEQMEVRYHDEDMVLKVTNGLCYDIFFRADDVFRPDFDEIPDFFSLVLEDEKKKSTLIMKDYKKPLDSGKLNRTYLLSPDEKEEVKPSQKKNNAQGKQTSSSKPRSRSQSNSRRRRRRR